MKAIKNKAVSQIRHMAKSGKSTGLALLAAYIDQKQNQMRLTSKSFLPMCSDRATSCLEKVREHGICVIENFWSEKKCREAREDIDQIIKNYPEYLHPAAKADERIYGANNASVLIDAFNKDPFLAEVANAYNEEPTTAAFTLGARLSPTSGNLGSGEGWHRDAPVRQFKAILYLCDVNLDNGPFQMIGQSHALYRVISDMWRGKLSYPQYRLSQEEVDRIIMSDPKRLLTYTAKAGTVIMADVSAIHRGMPSRSGLRYALTNYYFPVDLAGSEMYKKFMVLPAPRKR